jgi:hypothetical protein
VKSVWVEGRANIFLNTMHFSHRNIGIFAALIVSSAMVGFALWLTSPIARVEAISTEELLRAYAAKDKDADGLPDWQEALYGTDPAKRDSVKAGIPDGEAVAQGLVKPLVASNPDDAPKGPSVAPDIEGANAAPGTLTDRFAREFLQKYLTIHGTGTPSSEQLLAFIKSSIETLKSSYAPANEYDVTQVLISGTGAEALQTYAARAESAFAVYARAPGKSEIEYVSDALLNDEVTALEEVKKMGEARIAIGQLLMTVGVPEEARLAHLAFANALIKSGRVVVDMAAIKSDPLLGFLGLGLFEETLDEVTNTYAALNDVFVAQNTYLSEGEPGFFFYRGSVHAGQNRTQTP